MQLDIEVKTGYYFEGYLYDNKEALVKGILYSHIKLWMNGRYATLPAATRGNIAMDIVESLTIFKGLEAEIRHEVSTIVG